MNRLVTQAHYGKTVAWTPRDDITASELAEAVAVLLIITHGGFIMPPAAERVAALPESVRRHFTITQVRGEPAPAPPKD
ncbi:MAG: hypothetical protein GEU91_18680 [Rhizobiales bacterium]|nr:hypothetical protein [Hyphomicrobiales bacterium]